MDTLRCPGAAQDQQRAPVAAGDGDANGEQVRLEVADRVCDLGRGRARGRVSRWTWSAAASHYSTVGGVGAGESMSVTVNVAVPFSFAVTFPMLRDGFDSEAVTTYAFI